MRVVIFITQDLLRYTTPRTQAKSAQEDVYHPGGNPGANFHSIFIRCYLREEAFEWELTKESICLPQSGLLGGFVKPA